MKFLHLNTSNFSPIVVKGDVSTMLYGLTTLADKWLKHKDQLPINISINPSFIPNDALIEEITTLVSHTQLVKNDMAIAINASDDSSDINTIESKVESNQLQDIAGLLEGNKKRIITECLLYQWPDHKIVTKHGKIQQIIHPTAQIDQAILNTDSGPIYIGPHVHIMDGALIQGPVAILDHSVVKMGTRIYPGTSIGSYCNIGGEIKNSIIHEYSNKSHDGYLGDSVLGRWNNLGAHTNVSNVSNTFGPITTYDWNTNQSIKLKTIKRGVITGDFVKTGIQTKIYAGTKIGAFSSIACTRPISKNIQALSWHTDDKTESYLESKAKDHASRQMNLKNQTWSPYWQNQLKAWAHLQ